MKVYLVFNGGVNFRRGKLERSRDEALSLLRALKGSSLDSWDGTLVAKITERAFIFHKLAEELGDRGFIMADEGDEELPRGTPLVLVSFPLNDEELPTRLSHHQVKGLELPGAGI